MHPEILHAQGIPEELLDEKTVWEDRYRSIVDLEGHLNRNGNWIVKFYLHLSQEEQRKRFLERIDEPRKNRKFSQSDIAERMLWEHYMRAYEACLSETSIKHGLWYVVPADDKENARLETLDAYRDHGESKARLEQDVEEADGVLGRLPELGISIDSVTRQLEDEGVEKFNKPFDKLMATLAQRSPRI